MRNLNKNSTPYKKSNFSKLLPFARKKKLTLTKKETASLSRLDKALSLGEVDKIYLPLSELLDTIINSSRGLNKSIDSLLNLNKPRGPFIIGVAGSVAVGKSTFSKIIKEFLGRSLGGLKVDIVTTDGFLFPNEYLEKNNIMEKKGFPESYDTETFFEFLSQLKKGKKEVLAPVYSHLLYNILPSKKIKIKSPDVLILEGINILQTSENKNLTLVASDFFDFSIYIDAEEKYLREWFVKRFLSLKLEASNNKESHFNRLSSIPDEEAANIAKSIWKKINLVNLNENILPTRGRADLVIKKIKDHKIDEIWLRNI